ncbi:thiol-disulfide oxidoreductase DCC family protein [Flavobacteriaceae bacterium KMM 6897]|nr:thiol-disulfide oxidoreductase DCC family protein [Flavobacteriaceae bacterium KMM 6897]MEB8345339.1 thiol-disulfide oxidoreductase DCC family protein [Flavobacteriaceae bacterium KMM 6898]
MEETKKIILFDGVCNLCNGAIQFIIKHDKDDNFRYAPLQSAIGRQYLQERNIDTTEIDSIVLIEPGIAYYTKAVAALKIGQAFGGAWKLVQVFEWIPESISNFFYDIIAKNRYNWFGKKDACMIPTPELKAKFLE